MRKATSSGRLQAAWRFRSRQLVSLGRRSAFRLCGRDLVEFFNSAGWALCGRWRVWLRYVVRVSEEKDGDLFIWNVRNDHGAMNVVTGLVPIHLFGRDPNTQTGPTVAELNRQNLAFENNRNAMKWIYVPPRGLAGSEY